MKQKLTAARKNFNEVMEAAKRVGLRVNEDTSLTIYDEIFQIDVDERSSKAKQTFRIWPGKSKLKLVATSKKLKQVLMTVKEPPRTIRASVEYEGNLTVARHYAKEKFGDRLIDVVSNAFRESCTIHFKKKISGDKRYILFGVDEDYYFACELSGPATTVAGAHKALRPKGAKGKGVKRQGEFFFVPADPDEVIAELIEGAIHRVEESLDELFEKESEDSHIAEETIHNDSWGGGEVYACGTIKHKRHKTLRLKTWHRVLMNTEKLDGDGLGFID